MPPPQRAPYQLCQRNSLQFRCRSTYTEFMFSSPRSPHDGVRARIRPRRSTTISRRPWASLAMIFVWTAAPAAAAACGVHCQSINVHACCQQHRMPMRNMPMPNMPMPHRHMTNLPMPNSCGAFVLEAASIPATVVPENRSASAFARIRAAGLSGAVSDLRAVPDYSSFAAASLAHSPSRMGLALAPSAIPLRI